MQIISILQLMLIYILPLGAIIMNSKWYNINYINIV